MVLAPVDSLRGPRGINRGWSGIGKPGSSLLLFAAYAALFLNTHVIALLWPSGKLDFLFYSSVFTLDFPSLLIPDKKMINNSTKEKITNLHSAVYNIETSLCKKCLSQ